MAVGELLELSFSEGQSVSAPTLAYIKAAGLKVYASDAAFVSAKGSAAAQGDSYFNSTFLVQRIYDGTNWRYVPGANVFQSKTTTYGALITDDFISITTASGWTLTLPTPVGFIGKEIEVLKTSSDFNVLTIGTAAGSIAEYGTTTSTTTINTTGEYCKFKSDGTNWMVISRRVDGPWTAYTPTLASSTNVSVGSCMYRRIGQGIQIKAKLNWTGNGGAGTFTCTLPSGLTADTGLIDQSAAAFDGTGLAKQTNARSVALSLGPDTTNAYSFRYSENSGTNIVAGSDFANGNTLAFIGWAPISGWKY